MDLESLLSDRSEGGPSGENLEYDMDFIALELAAAPGEEKQAGKAIIAAEDPDWSDVKSKAISVLERSHDLRAAVHLAQAALYTDGLPGLAEVTGYIRGCVENFWATCHPQLDPDDDNDPTMRINAVENLAGASTVLRGLRRARLAESRGFGIVTLRDLQIVSGEASAADGETAMPQATIDAVFQDADADLVKERLAAARKAIADVDAIDRKFSDEISVHLPKLDDLTRMLKQIVRFLGDRVGGEAPAEETATDVAGASGGPVPSGGGGGRVSAPGSINSPRDVHAALDAIMAYYRRSEPSSPVPVILARAKRLVGADFLAILKDMAPAGIENVALIGGFEEED